MITINTFRTSNVSVGVMHLGFPFLAICVLTTTNTTLRLFNSDIEAIYLDMTFLVVASFFLCFSRIGINLCFLLFACTFCLIFCCNTFSHCKQIFTDSFFFSSFIRFFLLCIRRLLIFARRSSGYITVRRNRGVGFILFSQSTISNRLLTLHLGRRPYFFLIFSVSFSKNATTIYTPILTIC